VQDLFLRYKHLAGMTGTAMTAVARFRKVYHKVVVPVRRTAAQRSADFLRRMRMPLSCRSTHRRRRCVRRHGNDDFVIDLAELARRRHGGARQPAMLVAQKQVCTVIRAA